MLSFALSLTFQKENIGDLLTVNTQLSQAGMYTCTAQTVVDSASASAKLVVRGKMHQSFPCFHINSLKLLHLLLQKHEKKNIENKEMNI